MNTNRDSVFRAILERLQSSLATPLLRNLAEEEVKFAGAGKNPVKAGNTVRTTIVQPGKPGGPKSTAIWTSFPRSISGYSSMVSLLCDAVDDTTTFFGYLLSWLSDKCAPVPPFDYNTFIGSISSGPLKPLQQEVVDLIINIVVSDILATYFSRGEPKPPQQLQEMFEMGLRFPTLNQAGGMEPNVTLRAVATTQWSVVLGLMSPLLLSQGDQFLGNYLQKLRSEPTPYYMPFLKNIRLSVRNEKEIAETTLFIDRFMNIIISLQQNKSPETKNYLQIFTEIITSLDLAASPEIFSKVKLDTKMMDKMAKNEEMDPIVTKYKAVLMAYGANDYFTSNIQETAQKILKKVQNHSKNSDDYLEALVTIFRGAHHQTKTYWLPYKLEDASKEFDSIDNNMYITRKLPSNLYPEASKNSEFGSPFVHAPFFEKMRIQKQTAFEIMRSMTRNIFSSKFKLWSNPKVSTITMAELVTQAATHSFDYLHTEILPGLLQQGNNINDSIVALQALSMLVSPELKYPTDAYCFTTDKNTPPSKDIISTLHQEILKAVNSSIKTFATNIELTDQSSEYRDNVGCYLLPGQVHFKTFEPLFSSSIESQRPSIAYSRVDNYRPKGDLGKNNLLPLSHIDEILKTTLDRVKKLISTDENERREKHYKGLIQHTKKTSKTIEQWVSADCSFGYPDKTQFPEEPKPKLKKQAKDERLRQGQVSLLKELLNSLLILPPDSLQNVEIQPFGAEKIKPPPLFSYLVLHQDDDISNLVLHFFQRVIVEIPRFRTILLMDLLQTFNTVHSSKQQLKYFVFSQISVLIDLWNSVYYTEVPGKSENFTTEADLEGIVNLIQSLEQISLYYLCSTIPEFRLCALNVLNGVSLLYFLHTKNTKENVDQVRISSILKIHEHFILGEARLSFLQELSMNLFDHQRMRHDTPIDITIREIAGSMHERLWTFVLNQIGRCLALYDDSASIVRLRCMNKILDDFDVDHYSSSQTVVPTASTEGLENGIVFVPTLFSNLQLLLFSLANSKLLQKVDAEGAAQAQKILRHLSAWGELLAENQAIVLSRVQATKMISWDAAGVVLSSLWTWYSKIPPKKKGEIRPFIAQILHTISLHSDFQRGIVGSRSVGQCYLQFIEEIPQAWEHLHKSSDLNHAYYYLCNTGIVINVMIAMHKSHELSLVGPLRKQFISQPHWVLSEQWQTKHKNNLVTFFRERIPTDFMSVRARLDRGEVDKLLAGKEKEIRERIKIVTGRQLTIIADRSALAIEALSRVFTLVDASAGQSNVSKFWKEIDGWILPVQRICPHSHLMPWLISHDEDLIPSFMDKAYTTDDILDKAFYTHSIYSQFVSAQYFRVDSKFSNSFKRNEKHKKERANAQNKGDQSANTPPTTHAKEGKDGEQTAPPKEVIYNSDSFYYTTTHVVMDQFIESKILEEELLYNATHNQLTSNDVTFSKKIYQYSGKLLQFLFYCLIQTEVNIRIGAFHCLLRLGPVEFGNCLDVNEDVSIKKVRLAIAHHEANINSPLEEVWLESAVAISEILCHNCNAITFDFLTAWISVWEHLTPLEQSRSCSIVQKWGKNVVLSESGPLSSQFLESLFETVTVVSCSQPNVVASYVFSVWESFCIVSPANMSFAVKFLVLRGVTKGQLEICRRLIQHLALKAHLPYVLDTLLANLSFQGIMENINRVNQERLNRAQQPQPTGQSDSQVSPRSIEGNPKKINSGTLGAKSSRRNQQNINANAESPAKKKDEKTGLEQVFSLMRKATTSILADLIGNDVKPILPNLHILLQYCILYLDQDQHLLHVLATILKGLREIFINGLTNENQTAGQECINIINNILTLMRLNRHSFILWDSTTSKNGGEQRELLENILKGFPVTQLSAQASKNLAFVAERKVHSDFLDIVPQKMHISTLLKYLIQILSSPILADVPLPISASSTAKPVANSKNFVHLWGQQCLLWGILFPDPLMSTKSLELYSRIVKPCSMETLIKLSTNLHYSVERLQTISSVSKAIQKGALVSEIFSADAQDVDLLRVRVQVLVESFIQIANVTDSENYIVYLFFVAVALLETSPLTHPGVYNGGVNLLTAVLDSKTFKLVEKSAFKQYVKVSDNWNFSGLYKLLLESLKSPKSDINGVSLIRKLLSCPNLPQELFYAGKKYNAELQDALWFLSILPWIQFHLFLPYHESTDCGDEFSTRNNAKFFLESIAHRFNVPTKKFHVSVSKYIQKFIAENYRQSAGTSFSLDAADKFISGLTQILGNFFFSTHAASCFSTIVELFQQTPKLYHNTLANITDQLLQLASKEAGVEIPGHLTDLLVLVTKDAELGESSMTRKLLSFENTTEVPKEQKAVQKLHLQNVEIALKELVAFLKTRSNRHSAMNVDTKNLHLQDKQKDKKRSSGSGSTRKKDKDSSSSSKRSIQKQDSIGETVAATPKVEEKKPEVTTGFTRAKSERPSGIQLGNKKTSGWVTSRGVGATQDDKRRNENAAVTSSDDLSKTRSSPNINKPPEQKKLLDGAPRDRLIRIQKGSAEEKKDSETTHHHHHHKKEQVIDDGLADLRDMLPAALNDFDPSSSSDSSSGSESSSEDNKIEEESSEDIDNFSGLDINGLDAMRAFLMGDQSKNVEVVEDDSGTFDSESDNSDESSQSGDDLSDLRGKLEGLGENF